MSLSFGYELFEGYPVPEDGISFDSAQINNVTPLLEVDGKIVSAGLNLSTITITLKGIPVDAPPFPEVNAEDFGNYTFTFRNNEYILISTSRGPRLRVGNSWIFLTWSCTGIRTDAVKLSI